MHMLQITDPNCLITHVHLQ